MKKLSKQSEKYLYSAILSLKTQEDCRRFLDDLLTPNELRTLIQRMEVAKELAGGLVYSEIVKNTGASTATISRVNKCLSYGSGGYRAVLERTVK